MEKQIILPLLFFITYLGGGFYRYFDELYTQWVNQTIDESKIILVGIVFVFHSVFFGLAGFMLQKAIDHRTDIKAFIFFYELIVITFACWTVWMALDHNPQKEFFHYPFALITISLSWIMIGNLILAGLYGLYYLTKTKQKSR